jgi:transporter family-2 protein
MLGAFYLLTTILVPPRIGVAAFFSLVVLGQLCASLIFDHFGLLGLPIHPVNPWRVLGVALLIAGVALIRRF